jgi:hypothetical protein
MKFPIRVFRIREEATDGGEGGGGEGQAVEFSLPEQFSGKEHFSGIDSYEKLYESFDKTHNELQNAQGLIGKKTIYGLPGETAGDQEWSEYYKAIGRPDSAEQYSSDYTPKDQKMAEELKDVFFKLGASQKQFSDFHNQIGPIVEAFEARETEAQQKQFDEVMSKVFTSEEQKEKAIKTADSMFKQIESELPGELREHLKAIDGNSKILMSAVLNKINEKYIGEDSTSTNEGGVGVSVEGLNVEIARLDSELAKMDEGPEYDAKVEKVNKLYKRRSEVKK